MISGCGGGSWSLSSDEIKFSIGVNGKRKWLQIEDKFCSVKDEKEGIVLNTAGWEFSKETFSWFGFSGEQESPFCLKWPTSYGIHLGCLKLKYNSQLCPSQDRD